MLRRLARERCENLAAEFGVEYSKVRRVFGLCRHNLGTTAAVLEVAARMNLDPESVAYTLLGLDEQGGGKL